MAKCRRCHRPLKTPECIKVGYGKVCFQKTFGKPFPKERKYRISIPSQKDVVEATEEMPPLFDDIYFT